MYVPGACGGQKKASDPLELELQKVVSCRRGCRELGPGSLEEQPVLLIIERSPQPLIMLSSSRTCLFVLRQGLMM